MKVDGKQAKLLWPVLVAIIAFAVVLALGATLLKSLFSMPHAKGSVRKVDVSEFLARPLPVPNGAKRMNTEISGRPEESGAKQINPSLSDLMEGPDEIELEERFVLDVTHMKPKDIEKIPQHYSNYFDQHFSFGRYNGQGDDIPEKIDPKLFMFAGKEWTWRYVIRLSNGYVDVRIDTQVFDVKRDIPFTGGYSDLPVRQLTDPIREQRVACVRVTVVGRHLLE